MTRKVKHLMETLDLTEQEALELLAEDKKIDQDKKLVKLPGELEAGAKKARRAERKPTTNVKRERKIDETKKRILNYCRIPLEGAGATVLGMKTETEILFEMDGTQYSLKLIKHRPS